MAQGLLTASRYRSQACSHITADPPPRQYLHTATTAEHCYKRILICDAHLPVSALSSHSRLEAFNNDWHSETCLGQCHTVSGLMIPDSVTPVSRVSFTVEPAEGATRGATQMGTVYVSKKISSGLLGPGDCSNEVRQCRAVSVGDYIRALDQEQQTWAENTVIRAGLQHLPVVGDLLGTPAIAVITVTGNSSMSFAVWMILMWVANNAAQQHACAYYEYVQLTYYEYVQLIESFI